MLPLPAPDEPLRIEIARPAALPGVTVGRFVSDGRLHCGVKDRVGTVQNYAGHCEWWARRRVWQSRPGTLQLKLPGEVHRELRRDGPARFQVVLFEDELLVEASEALGLRFTAPASLAIAGDSPVGAPLARLHALLLAGDAEALVLQTALAEALQAVVEHATPPREGRARRWGAPVRRALERIDAGYTGPISLDELAAHAGLDKFHLCRAFRDEVGLPPYAYVTHRRIVRAQALLVAGVPPSEVAAQVGLCDQSQLNRHFKRIVGVTPRQFASAAR